MITDEEWFPRLLFKKNKIEALEHEVVLLLAISSLKLLINYITYIIVGKQIISINIYTCQKILNEIFIYTHGGYGDGENMEILRYNRALRQIISIIPNNLYCEISK